MLGFLGRALLAAWLLALAPTHRLLAQESISNDDLIAMLSSERYEVRESASTQLLERGSEVVPALKKVFEATASRETKSRVELLLRELDQKRLRTLSQAFLADQDGTNSHGLPGWNLFRSIAGATRSAKQLYLDAVKSQADLVGLIEQIMDLRSQSESSGAAESELASLSADRASRLLTRLYTQGTIGTGDSVAMLMTAAALKDPAPIEVSELIRAVADVRFGGLLNRPSNRGCIIKLLSQWVPKSPESMAPDVMRISFGLDVATVLPVARKHLSRAYDPFTREQAILCLGKFGGAEDVPALLQYSSDGTVIDRYLDVLGSDESIVESQAVPPGLNSPIISVPQKLVRVNDLCVVVAMRLLKEDPKGMFPQYRADNFMQAWRAVVAVAEADQADRDQAIQKWALAHALGQPLPASSNEPVADPIP